MRIIPDAVFVFCNNNGIQSLVDLIRFHDKCGSFCIFDTRRMPIKELTFLYSRAKHIQEYERAGLSAMPNNLTLPISTSDIDDIVKISTTLDEMFAVGRISQRTINCCTSTKLFVINDLIEYKINNKGFNNIRNCGKKSIQEIEDLIASYEAANVDHDNASFELKYKRGLGIAENLSQKFINYLKETLSIQVALLPNSVKQYMKSTYPSVESYYAKMYAYRSLILNSVPELSASDNMIMRSTYLTITQKVISWLKEYLLIRSKKAECFIEINNNIEEKITKLDCPDRYQALSEIQKNYVNEKYLLFCEKNLSVRAKKIQEQFFPSVDHIITHFYDSKDEFLLLFTNFKHSASGEELFKAIRKFKDEYDVFITHSNEYIASIINAKTFPFLLSFQKKFINEYYNNSEHLPMFFILSQYLKSSEQRNDQIYSLYYGISDGKAWTCEEIAPKFDVTYERVRQIVSTNRCPPVSKGSLISHKDWAAYDIFQDKFISENSLKYQIIFEEERLRFDFFGFAGLIRLFKRHNLVDILGTPFVIDRTISDEININKLIKDINILLKKKRTQDSLVHITEYVSNWNKLSKEKRADIIFVASQVVREALGIEMNNKGDIKITQNTINKEREIIDILSGEHRPMHVNEIASALVMKHPNEKWTIDTVRHIIQKSDEIAPIGKSSTYGLKNWDHIFFGSIRDLLLDILSESDDPLHIDEILDRVSVSYPNTNKKSVSSTMMSDKFDRFEVFENGYYGLSDKQYSDIYIKIPEEQRFTFERRIEMFREFVDTYHRFPISNSGALESSLKRWHYNVINNIVQITPDQRQIFDTMIDEYSALKYPQSALEVTFLENCESVKEIIQKKHRLPQKDDDHELFSWLRHYLSRYQIYDDQRKIYFEDLLRYIYSYGFSIT